MKKYLQLTVQIFRHGTWRGSGQDFNHNRASSLETLQEFIPQQCVPRNFHAVKHSTNNFRAQAAFIKSAFKTSGRHLSDGTLAYIRIPKAANTSISYAMLVKKYPGLQEKAPDETQINFLTDVNLRRLSDADAKVFFTVVRNPFARLVSVYRDFFEYADKQKFMYADYLFGILKQDISFAEFVDRINKIPDRLKDQHFKPQHLFLSPYERKGIAVKVFPLEDRVTLEQFMDAHEMQLTHRNKSQVAYDYTQYYTPELIEKVYNIYWMDIEKFGYRKVYEELKS